jgi:hypothetical protein
MRPNAGTVETKEGHLGDHLESPGAITCNGNGWHCGGVNAEAAASMLSVFVDVVQPPANRRYYALFSALEFAQR